MKREAKNKLQELLDISKVIDFNKPYDLMVVIVALNPYIEAYENEVEDNFYSISSDQKALSYIESEFSTIDALVTSIYNFNNSLDIEKLQKICNLIEQKCKVNLHILKPRSIEEKERMLNLFKPKKNFPSIFKDANSYEKYLSILKTLHAIDEKGIAINRRFQPIAKAIFDEADKLFVYNTLLKDYIEFLNETFNAGILSDSRMSDGTNHAISVRKLL